MRVTGRRPARVALDSDRKGRPGAQILRHPIEDHPDRQAVVAKHLDPLADLEDDAAIGGEHPRPLARLGAGGGIGPDQGDRLADRLLHQRLGREQVEIEILLDDAEAVAGEGHRLGADLGRDVGKFLARAAGGEGDLPRVLHQREIVVVDGDRDLALRALRGRRDFGLDLGERRRGEEAVRRSRLRMR